jgi:hypothetical protein
VNKWQHIFDFTEEKNGDTKNFSFLDPSEFQLISKEVPDLDSKPVQVFPISKEYGGTLEESTTENHNTNDNNMKSFGFDVS